MTAYIILYLFYKSFNSLKFKTISNFNFSRTGRAGNKGFAYTFITAEQGRYAHDIIRALELSGCPVPEDVQKLWDGYKEEVKAVSELFVLGWVQIVHEMSIWSTCLCLSQEVHQNFVVHSVDCSCLLGCRINYLIFYLCLLIPAHKLSVLHEHLASTPCNIC